MRATAIVLVVDVVLLVVAVVIVLFFVVVVTYTFGAVVAIEAARDVVCVLVG